MTLEVPYRSIPHMFFTRVADTPDRRAFGYPAPDGSGPVWTSWAEVAERASAIAAGLRGLGVENEDRVAIMASTRYEWVLADLGIMCAGAATTTVYPTTAAEEAVHILRDSGARVVIAEDASQVAKLAGAQLPELRQVVLVDGDPDPGATPAQLTLADLSRAGGEALSADPDLVTRVAESVRPDQLATLIYTSGATGAPKGVELLHAGWCWEGVAQGELRLMTPDDLQYLWLPLSHSFGKTVLCGLVHVGVPTYVDGRVDKLVDNLAVIRPTLMCAAPRIFEKVYNRAVTSAQAHGGPRAKIFEWAVRVGREKVTREQAGRKVPGWLALRHRIASALVFSKLRDRLGGRIRTLISGSAPLSREISEFFAAAGLPILEGYGLTEASAGNFVNRPGKLRIGTVGQALGDLECRIAEDGEILLRGVPIMRGYRNLPEQTAEAMDGDGWFHTGDIGELTEDGYLSITDRKKDLMKTSGGKYIAPSRIEGMFKAICPYVSQAVVIGQSRNYCTMLITLDPDSIAAWAAGGPLERQSYAQVAGSAEVRELVGGYVDELNARLNRWETIKKFSILPRDLTIEDGEVTPSMKVKRRGVETNFADTIASMYDGAVASV